MKIAICLINIDVIHDTKEHSITTLECREKALSIKQKYHERNHSDVIGSDNSIGLMHEQLLAQVESFCLVS
jgi:hypothetical protein